MTGKDFLNHIATCDSCDVGVKQYLCKQGKLILAAATLSVARELELLQLIAMDVLAADDERRRSSSN